MIRWAILTILFLPSAAAAQSIDTILAAARERDAATGCRPADRDEVVVCARDDRRHRLPLPTQRDPSETGAVAGEAPRVSVADPYRTGCGIFAGQGRCSKKEAEAYGYGRGRDPVTLVGRLFAKAIDGDAEVGPPPPPLPASRD